MNLREQLKEILPDILPKSPNQSIKGTELIELVKDRLKQGYSDATLRYHFSIMSCDPSSPIAKVEQGQGYYLRSNTVAAWNIIPSHHGGLDPSSPFTSIDSDLSIRRANKFRAVVQRYFESIHCTPFFFEDSFTKNALRNRWIVPDLAVVEWLAGEASSDGYILDKHQLQVHRQLGRCPVRITGAKLRLELTHIGFLEELYQCLATSEWANGGEMIVASDIDRDLAEQTRPFAARYGIGITSFGLEADVLDDMPEPAAIENLSAREFEAIHTLFEVKRFAPPRMRADFDWEHITTASVDNSDFSRFRRWLSGCLAEERIICPRDFAEQERAEVSVPTEFVA